MPYLIDNPEVGYVQTRWVFVNPDESYLTKVRCMPGMKMLGCQVGRCSQTQNVLKTRCSGL